MSVASGMLAASAVMGVAGSVQSANAQRTAGAYTALGNRMSADAAARQGMDSMMKAATEAEYREYEARMIRQQSEDEVEKIREAATRVRSNQTARAAASGVVIGEGSMQALRDETTRLTERDALVVMYTGSEKALMKEYEAENIRKAGSNAFNQSYMDGVEKRIAASAAESSARDSANATLLSGIGSGISTGYEAYKAY